MIGWRIPLSTICLLTGVSFATDPSTGWRAIGGVFLVFVPALIADHVITVDKRRRLANLSMGGQLPEPRSETHPDSWLE
jgi:hypothetical protein